MAKQARTAAASESAPGTHVARPRPAGKGRVGGNDESGHRLGSPPSRFDATSLDEGEVTSSDDELDGFDEHERPSEHGRDEHEHEHEPFDGEAFADHSGDAESFGGDTDDDQALGDDPFELEESEAGDVLDGEAVDLGAAPDGQAQALVRHVALLAARALLRPLGPVAPGRVSPALTRELLAAATRAGSRLIAEHGPAALCALPALAAHVGQQALRSRVHPRLLPQALTRAAAELARRPVVVQQLAAKATGCSRAEGRAQPAEPKARARRLRVNGPIEIVIYER
jgi:hypothetical protein